jgi:hypothetical protein
MVHKLIVANMRIIYSTVQREQKNTNELPSVPLQCRYEVYVSNSQQPVQLTYIHRTHNFQSAYGFILYTRFLK